MRYLSFFLSVYMLAALAYAGPQNKWVYVGTESPFDGIALLFAVGAFAWLYIIYRDFKGKKKSRKEINTFMFCQDKISI